MEFDEIVYRNLYKKIVDREVRCPEGLNITELNGWASGYAKCQLDILDIIAEQMKEFSSIRSGQNVYVDLANIPGVSD